MCVIKKLYYKSTLLATLFVDREKAVLLRWVCFSMKNRSREGNYYLVLLLVMVAIAGYVLSGGIFNKLPPEDLYKAPKFYVDSKNLPTNRDNTTLQLRSFYGQTETTRSPQPTVVSTPISSGNSNFVCQTPVDVMLVIDVSSSMVGEKLAELKTALTGKNGFIDIIAQNPESRIGFVSFAGVGSSKRITQDLTNNTSTVKAKINQLSTGSGTCLQCGIAVDGDENDLDGVYSRGNDKNHRKLAIILTDGVINQYIVPTVSGRRPVGIQGSMPEQEKAAEEAALVAIENVSKKYNVEFSVVQFGVVRNADYLNTIVSRFNGNGIYCSESNRSGCSPNSSVPPPPGGTPLSAIYAYIGYEKNGCTPKAQPEPISTRGQSVLGAQSSCGIANPYVKEVDTDSTGNCCIRSGPGKNQNECCENVTYCRRDVNRPNNTCSQYFNQQGSPIPTTYQVWCE
jgi:hypothetical protein